VHGATIRTEPSSDLPLGARAMSGPERHRLEASIAHYYALFLRRVAGGRRRPVRAVEPVAQGRVWSGRAAKEHGLVDRLGTFHDALRRLYEHLGLRPGPWQLPRWDISHASHSPSQRLLQALLADASAATPQGSLLARLASVLRVPMAVELLLDRDMAGTAQPLALLEWELDPTE
jgi:ClpP class serine protease